MLGEAEIALRHDQYRRAKRLFKAALANGEPAGQCLGGLAEAEYHLREFRAAEIAATQALQADASQYRPHLIRAYMGARTGDLKSAAEELQRSLEIAPASPDVHAFRGGILLAEGRVEEARLALQQAASLGADDWVYHSNLANLHLWEHREREGQVELWRAFKQHPAGVTARPLAALFLQAWRLPLSVMMAALAVLALAFHSAVLLALTVLPLASAGLLATRRGYRRGLLAVLAGVLVLLLFLWTR